LNSVILPPRLKRHIKSEALWQCGVPAFLKKSQPPLWAAIPVCVIVLGEKFELQGHGALAGDRGRQSNYVYGAAKAIGATSSYFR
jgi:hypothetical protein